MSSPIPKLALTISSALLVLCAAAAFAQPCRQVIEEELAYTAVKGDYLKKIAGMHGVGLDYLLKHNPQERKHLRPGDKFKITRRTIVPSVVDEGVVVNIPDRTLYIFRDGGLVAHFPVGLGKPEDWETPSGRFKVLGKQKDPTWHVPLSIQKEMAEKGEEVITSIPPGAENPLGRYAVRLSAQAILIHATLWPESVYQFRSHGCIRMRDKDIEKVYGLLEPGDDVTIIYQPVKLALTDEGRIFIEVHPDVYTHAGDLGGLAESEIKAAGLQYIVDWDKVREAVLERDGIAVDITGQEVEFKHGQTGVHTRGADDRRIPWYY